MSKFRVQQVFFVNDLHLWGLRPKGREDVTHDFAISKLVMLIKQTGSMLSLLVES